MAALRRVAGMMRKTAPTRSFPPAMYPTLIEGLSVRRVVLLRSGSPHRSLHSDATRTPDEKLDAVIGDILSKGDKGLPNDVVEDLFFSAASVRQQCFRKELSRSWMVSSALVAGGFVGCLVGWLVPINQKCNDRERREN